MLKLVDIKKDYLMKDSAVHALKGINLNFRKNEFVSILGPSGCGKTTLLNILGGLDHYTSGDLIIEGRSTKDFVDHDWDIYRNHRIGFIFQSYNLIPHENIQENVELALTIGGISKDERERRAKEALDKVGLKDLYKKMPNQLSGGQCQRVAIARALVNEPEILLADEPTGALDSVTSVQIMELIKEISKDKLVIMVTHNPELAYQYSTRIVKLLDGELVDDSNPYTSEEEADERENGDVILSEKERAKNDKEKAKMSWWTAFKLSTKNLLSKSKRTVLTVIAASIGIVGVSAVLSIRSGVTGYIDGMQDEMLSGNPITVSESTFDLSSIASEMTGSSQATLVKDATKDGYVDVDFLTQRLIDSAKSMGKSMIENNITQEYMDFVEAMPKDYYKDIVYNYGIDPSYNIYTYDNINGNENNVYSLSGITAIASAILEKKLADNGYEAYASTIKSYSSTFSQSINSEDYLLEQYDIVNGKVATGEDEINIVLSSDDQLTDFMLTLLGYFSQDEFMNIIYKFNTDDDGNPDSRYNDELYQKTKQFAISDLVNKEFTYYPNNVVFEKNENYDSSATMAELVFNADKGRPFYYQYNQQSSWEGKGTKLKVVGVLRPKEGRQYSTLSSGFYYTPAFTKKYMKDNSKSEISEFIRPTATDSDTVNPTYSSTTITTNGLKITTGIYYDFNYNVDGTSYTGRSLVGSTSSMEGMMSIFSQYMGGTSGSSSDSNVSSASLSLRATGGVSLPKSIKFYPNSFADKNLVTDYLDQWNDSNKTLKVNDTSIEPSKREEIKYTDNLAVVISIINTIINIVSVSLIAFTALSLVVSTVMIAIITYVSVMERIKEIGIIRALGGRKKDVSHLFNAETFIIGLLSGVFGIAVTYVIQVVLNAIIHANFPTVSSIASLPWYMALIVIVVSFLLTTIAGFIPSRGAAKKDPVVALRTE
jgi:putative ABC transport system permease protein